MSDLQLRQETLDILPNSLSQFASVLAHSVMENFDYNILRDSCHQLAMHLSALELPTYNDTTLNTDCISLTDHTVEALSVFLNENAKAPIKKISPKMSIAEYIGILFTVICTILPMLQNSYYQKINSLDNHHQQLMQTEFQEELIKLENLCLEEERLQTEEIRKHTEYLEHILQILTMEFSESPEDTQAFSVIIQTVPSQAQSVQSEDAQVPDTSEEFVVDADKVPDRFDTHDADE